MNCDEVFQHLTSVSEPKPMNGVLGRHLQGCPSCREMADLLCPAVELFDRGSNDDDAVEAAEPWQIVWDAVAVAERAAAQLKDKPSVPTARRDGYRKALFCAALLLVGAGIGCLIGRETVADLTAGAPIQPKAPSSSPSMLDDTPHGSCARLVALLEHGKANEFCPTCNRPFMGVKANICAICHINSPSATSIDDRVHSSL